MSTTNCGHMMMGLDPIFVLKGILYEEHLQLVTIIDLFPVIVHVKAILVKLGKGDPISILECQSTSLEHHSVENHI